MSLPPHQLARADQFRCGVMRLFVVEGRDIGVVKLSSGEFRAVLNRCPHKGAPVCRGTVGGTWPPSAPGELAYDGERDVLTCPWHGREFDLATGQELYQPRPGRLRLYPIDVVDGIVAVAVPPQRRTTCP
jgi:nitrite reductase/ring-hydroxylating ferredoxin subunit